MSDSRFETPGFKAPGAVRRKAIAASQESLVKIEPLYPERSLPLLIQPALSGVDLIAWAMNNQEMIKKLCYSMAASFFGTSVSAR